MRDVTAQQIKIVEALKASADRAGEGFHVWPTSDDVALLVATLIYLVINTPPLD